MEAYIYKIRNKINNKLYIGQTVQPPQTVVGSRPIRCNETRIVYTTLTEVAKNNGFECV